MEGENKEVWKGEYQGFTKRISDAGKAWFKHSIRIADEIKYFSSFDVPPELETAQGRIVIIHIIKTEEGYANLDRSGKITIEEPPKKAVYEFGGILQTAPITPITPQTRLEKLRAALKDANALLTEGLPEQAKLTPYEYSELVVKLAITLWIDKR